MKWIGENIWDLISRFRNKVYVEDDLEVTGDLTVTGDVVMMANLPTSDPSNAGQLWNDSNTLKISAG